VGALTAAPSADRHLLSGQQPNQLLSAGLHMLTRHGSVLRAIAHAVHITPRVLFSTVTTISGEFADERSAEPREPSGSVQ
jgi:hypothetical protein